MNQRRIILNRQPDKLLGDIIRDSLPLAQNRIFLYNQNKKLPTDTSLFVVIRSDGPATIVGSNSRFDSDTDEYVQTVTFNQEFNIEFSSKSTEAKTRKYEFVMALDSVASIQKQEEFNAKIWRTSNILDLSFIDGVSALHRYRLPVKMSYMETKRTAIEPIEQFPPTEVIGNE